MIYPPAPLLFNTLTYAYFFIAVFAVSWLLAPWRRARLCFLLLSSYVFYAGWTFVGWDRLIDVTALWQRHELALQPGFWSHLFMSIRYVPLLFVATSIDWALGRALGAVKHKERRQLLLGGTVLVNVGILVFFKYWSWGAGSFVWLVNAVFDAGVPDVTFTVELPIGISFFCFMSLSYVIDVYRRVIPPCRSYLEYLTYISFFPHLIAGPIIRGRDLLPHLARDTHVTAENGAEGLFLIATGLIKKVAIGDYLAHNLVDRVFAEPTSYSALETLAGMYGFAIQVYCDFSGYSDIAIGSALLLGYRFKINFDAPFKSRNVVEFWRRWHISLSTWLRDYVFFSLPSSKTQPWRKYLNMFITMVVCGIWHGAAWTFVLFGALQGGVMAATAWLQDKRRRGILPLAVVASTAVLVGAYGLQLWARRPGIGVLAGLIVGGGWLVGTLVWLAERYAKSSQPVTWAVRVLCVGATFTFTTLTFTMFRAQSLDLCWSMYERLLTLTTFTPNLHRNVVLIMLGALVLQWTPRAIYDRVREQLTHAPAAVQAVALFAVMWLVRQAAVAESLPFVYFQF